MDSRTTPDREMSESGIRTRKVGLFLALAFGIAWVGAIVLYLAEIELGTPVGLVFVVVVVMWAPAFAAIGTQLRYGESIREGCGISLGRLRWVGLGV
ncbi:hypothetical protein OB919_11090 [Halobacteria archaeon AArc-curdl1]|uniref:Uncharacterized protein n=1 Tax=Natronosalvus hydrolyticus TaxID=2979988 RepID=A0AAP2Z913_9EURY|nr:hypothetical protein [Halobacteria archaeon AArc-curdl1]